MRRLWLPFLGVLFFLPLHAQLTVSTLRGTAVDQTGAVVVNAEIKVVDTGTNLTRSVNTNENGDFEIVDLPRGTYRLTGSHPGFKTFVAENVVLESSQIRRVDVAFELGATGVEVTVKADAAVITTESGKIQTTFEKERFEELPLIGDGRTPDAVLVSLPLVQNAGGVYSVHLHVDQRQRHVWCWRSKSRASAPDRASSTSTSSPGGAGPKARRGFPPDRRRAGT